MSFEGALSYQRILYNALVYSAWLCWRNRLILWDIIRSRTTCSLSSGSKSPSSSFLTSSNVCNGFTAYFCFVLGWGRFKSGFQQSLGVLACVSEVSQPALVQGKPVLSVVCPL